jgi:hypothetical protein
MRGEIRNIGLDGQGLARRLSYRIEIGQDKPESGFGESVGAGAADAARGPRDDGDGVRRDDG